VSSVNQGPIIRISPYELHVSDPSFFDTIYSQEGRWDRNVWSWKAWGIKGGTIHSVDHDQHRARRKPLAPFFFKARVAGQQDVIRKHIEKFCDRMSGAAKSQETINIGAAVTAVARDIAFEFILAKTYNSQKFEASLLRTDTVGHLWHFSKHICWIRPFSDERSTARVSYQSCRWWYQGLVHGISGTFFPSPSFIC
jgi:cytochrome P450